VVVEVEEEAGDNWRDTGEPGTRQKCRRCRKSFSHSKTDNCRFWGVQRTRRQSIVCRASGRSNWASTSLVSNWRSRELQYREQTMGPQIVGPRPSDLVKIPAYVTAQAGRREVFLGTFLEYIPLLRFLCDIFQHFFTLLSPSLGRRRALASDVCPRQQCRWRRRRRRRKEYLKEYPRPPRGRP